MSSAIQILGVHGPANSSARLPRATRAPSRSGSGWKHGGSRVASPRRDRFDIRDLGARVVGAQRHGALGLGRAVTRSTRVIWMTRDGSEESVDRDRRTPSGRAQAWQRSKPAACASPLRARGGSMAALARRSDRRPKTTAPASVNHVALFRLRASAAPPTLPPTDNRRYTQRLADCSRGRRPNGRKEARWTRRRRTRRKRR